MDMEMLTQILNEVKTIRHLISYALFFTGYYLIVKALIKASKR